MKVIPIDRARQRKLKRRLGKALHGNYVYRMQYRKDHSGRSVGIPYDPFGKVAKAWAEWKERRRKRNEAKQ